MFCNIDSIMTSPSEGPVIEEIGDSVEEIIVGDPDGEISPSELTSKVSVSMKNHSLVVEVEGAPDLPDTPTITENGKTHHFTEAQVEPMVPKISGGDLLKATHLPISNELGVYLKRSKSERVRPRNTSQDEGVGDMDSFEQDISPRPHQRRLSMGHHPHSRHATPQRLTVEPENGNFGISTSDLSLDSNSSCNPSYKYGNQVIRIRKDRRRKRVPEPRGGWEEAVATPTNQQAPNLYTLLVRRGRLASVTRPRLWSRNATCQPIREAMEVPLI
ncbi:hypothetical protein SK128_027882 [Halocaridina rubra]|uniref:Uncharacterized protein n=1 Tax=Halocaridina rubra TaxID=373956 RepID=A0AAN8ZZD4_HALRR